MCDRAWLRTALQVLDEAGRPVTRIVPEFAPEGETVLYAIGDPQQQPLLVAAGSEGVSVLPLASQSLALLPALQQDAACVAEPLVAELAQQVLQRPPGLQQAPQRGCGRRSPTGTRRSSSSPAPAARVRSRKLGTAWAETVPAATQPAPPLGPCCWWR